MSTANEQAETNNEAKDRLAADLESLKASFGQLRADVTQLIGTAMGVGKTGAATAFDGAAAVREKAAGAVDGIKDRLGSLKDKGLDTAHAAEDKLAEHPLATLMIAFGAGFILAKILSRR